MLAYFSIPSGGVIELIESAQNIHSAYYMRQTSGLPDYLGIDEEDDTDLENAFRAGWQAAMTGEGVRSIDEFWAELDREENELK